MATESSVKSLLNRNLVLNTKVKTKILKEWETADFFERKVLLSILQNSEDELKTILINSFNSKPAQDFLKAWKEFENKVCKGIYGKVELDEAEKAEQSLLSELNSL